MGLMEKTVQMDKHQKSKQNEMKRRKQTTLTFYIDKDGDGNYTEGTDTLVQTTVVKDGQDGAKGAGWSIWS